MVAPGMNECREGQADGRADYGGDRRGQTCYSVTLGVDGQVDVVLVGDAYEDHWLEVISVGNGTAKTIFSGLGYYL